jgi:hypothetical protein
MTKHVASTTKKLFAAGGLAFGLAGFGIFAGVSTAVADGTSPDTGSYDELIENRDSGLDSNLAEDACWGGVASVPAAFEVGDPESAGCGHSRMAGSFGPNAS